MTCPDCDILARTVERLTKALGERVTALENGGIPAPAAVSTGEGRIPAGFEACDWIDSVRNELGRSGLLWSAVGGFRFGLRDGSNEVWLRPIPQPDPEKVATMLRMEGVANWSSNRTLVDIVRRALEKCR